VSRANLWRREPSGRSGRHAEGSAPAPGTAATVAVPPVEDPSTDLGGGDSLAGPRSLLDYEDLERRALRSRGVAAGDRGGDGALDERWWRPIVVDRPMLDFEPAPPTPGPLPYFPDTVLDGWSSADFTMRLAAVRGSSHRYRGQPRQDHAEAFCITGEEAEGERVIFAVADGVSNSAHGELGSLLAVQGAVRSLRRQTEAAGQLDWGGVLDTAVTTMVHGAQNVFGVANPSLREVGNLMATTLVCGMVWSTESGYTVALTRVGDSGAWVLDRHGFRPLFEPKRAAHAEVLPSGVAALPLIPAHPQEVRLKLLPDEVLLVGTDGFSDPLGDGTGEIGALFAHWLARTPPARGFAHLLDFSRDTFDDDRALVAIWPRRHGDER